MSHRTIAALLKPLAEKRGYDAVPISWDDSSRGYDKDGALSCWGENIADVDVVDHSAVPIFTVRSKNYNERIAYVKTSDLALVVGNEEATASKTLKPALVSDYLKRFGSFAQHVGAPKGCSLASELDDRISLRAQVVFVREDTEFTNGFRIYGSGGEENPQNIVLYCTSQGTSPYAPGSGRELVFLQNTTPSGAVEHSWLRAKRSEFSVGAEQKETDATRADALSKGSAVAMPIGPKFLGNKFNVVMALQVPLVQKEMPLYRGMGPSKGFSAAACAMGFGASGTDEGCVTLECFSATLEEQREQIGHSTAARVSKGTVEKTDWKSLARNTNWARHAEHRITATVTFYFAVSGGVPSAVDINRAMDELDRFYETLGTGGRRADTFSVNSAKDKPVSGPPKGFNFTYTAPTEFAFPTRMETETE